MVSIFKLIQVYANNTDNYSNELLNDLNANGYSVNLVSKSEAEIWLKNIIPKIVRNYIVETKQIKQCGHLSEIIAGLGAKNGIAIGIISEPGHFVAGIPLIGGDWLRVDGTHLQFEFSKGSLRDYDKEEIAEENGEYQKMKSLFDELKTNPYKAVEITYHKSNFPPAKPPQSLSEFFNPKLFSDDDLDYINSLK